MDHERTIQALVPRALDSCLFVSAHALVPSAFGTPGEKRLKDIFESRCPKKLFDALYYYMGADRSFDTMPLDARVALERAFSQESVRGAMEIITNGKTSLYMFESDIARYIVPERGRFQNLLVRFEKGLLASVELSEPYHACTIPADSW